MEMAGSTGFGGNSVMGLVRRPIEAARALAALLRNPDDTKQAFRLVDSISHTPSAALMDRFARSRGGQRLLAERPEILHVLRDRARLRAMPEGSLGRAYLAFMETDNLTADWLVEASARGSASVDPAEYFSNRLRDTHDLWHVATGYGGDLVGEGAVLVFSYAQTFALGVGVLASTGVVFTKEPDARRVLLDAFARGLTAAWLPGVEWEKLMERPLEDVRRELRLGPPRSYEPFHSRELPPGGILAFARTAAAA